MRARRAVVGCLLALLLVGCGREGAPASIPSAPGARAVVGLPGAYTPGWPFGGRNNTPSITRASFPVFTRTGAGAKSDPINVLVAASERQLRHVFAVSGWLPADPVTPATIARTIHAGLTRGEYPTSPMSDLLLYNRKQDMSYQKNAVSVLARDHLRVWRTPLTDRHARPFWAIAATKDVALRMGPSDRLPTHQISPDLDAERQLVVDDFSATGHVALRHALQVLPRGYKGTNGPGDEYYTDGRVEVLELVLLRERP